MRPSPIRSTRTPLRTLLEGEHSWGSFEQTHHGGVGRYRLVVHPPGLDREDRVALRLWRTFSVWGLGLWILLEVSLMSVMSPWAAVAAATGVCALVGFVLMTRSGGNRETVRTMTAVRAVGERDADADTVHALADRLVRADAALAAGTLSPVEHEAEAWRVYERMG